MTRREVFTLKDLFFIERGKSIYTKKYGDTHKGEYPVYSASNNNPLTNIESFDFDGSFLTWATNGFAGYIKLIDGKFSINADRGLLRPKKDGLDLIYIKNILEPQLRELAKGRKGDKGSDEFTKVYPSMIENLQMSIPVMDDGQFDVDFQKQIVKKIIFIQEVKQKLEDYRKQIKEVKVDLLEDGRYQTFKIKDVFEVERGSGRYIKRYTNTHKGNFPVYSGNTFGAFAHVDTYDYEDPCLSWAIDGLAGYMMIHNEKFSATNHRGMLVPKEDNIELSYAKSVLEPLFRAAKKGRIGVGGKNEYTALPPFMIEDMEFALPVNEVGEIDLDKQKEIATKYERIENIKSSLILQLDKVINVSVDFE